MAIGDGGVVVGELEGTEGAVCVEKGIGWIIGYSVILMLVYGSLHSREESSKIEGTYALEYHSSAF